MKSLHTKALTHSRMKKIYQLAIAATAVCLLAGCETTGLSPRESAGATYPNYILSLQQGGTNAPQRVSKPIRLALVQIGEAAPPEAMLDKLTQQKNLVTSVIGLPLPGDTVNNFYKNNNGADFQNSVYSARVKTICGLARSMGADYVFLFGGNLDSWQENNFSSTFDITIIGGTLLPGTTIHIEGKAAGALISTETCQPVFFVNAETRDSAMSPDFFVDGKTMGLRAKVRDELVAGLNDQLISKLTNMSAR
jgi:hypothetical protein